MIVDTKNRSQEVEIMDDLDMTGELLIDTLDRIAQINRYLGGNKLTLSGLKEVLPGLSTEKVYTIVDLGCGNGDMLRKIADFGKKKGIQFKLIGVDANKTTSQYAKVLSEKYDNIEFHHLDVFSKDFAEMEYDIALSTLFLHHFGDDKAVHLVKQLMKRASIGVIVNDLHRNRIAYYLFSIIATIVGNPMVKKDGLISILRGYKRIDLEKYAEQVGYTSSIKWKWAFRYQWIIKKK